MYNGEQILEAPEKDQATTGTNIHELPGFGKVIGGENNEPLIRTFNTWNSMGITLRELTMMKIMDEITDKDQWDTKVFDEGIAAKWTSEALRNGQDVSSRMMENCILELKDKARDFQKEQMIVTLDCEIGLVKADNLIDPAIKDLLRSAVPALEALKDWHPGSDNIVLDLVHPSLFPLMYEVSRVLLHETVPLQECDTYTGCGHIVPRPRFGQTVTEAVPDKSGYSKKYQWLPSEINFIDSVGTDDTPREAKIVSYVNNLHPRMHTELYTVLEHITTKAIPLWDKMFSIFENPRKPRIKYDYCEYTWPRGESRPESEKNPSETASQAEDLDYEWYDNERTTVYPEPEAYKRREWPMDPQSSISRTFGAKRGLQVIYKLANIHLSLDRPEYAGGSWHVEGMLNEHIVATALYYYDSENITDNRLCFRQSLESAAEYPGWHDRYEQNEFKALEDVYGVENDGVAIQDYGSVLTREDRLLVFPNALQHRVDKFKLVDPTKPGHRKIVALFLVDPNNPIISTAHVPPQQKSWWAPHVMMSKPLVNLPQELRDQIIDGVDDFPVSMEEAKNVRVALMKERTRFVEFVNEVWEQHTFSFCEH